MPSAKPSRSSASRRVMYSVVIGKIASAARMHRIPAITTKRSAEATAIARSGIWWRAGDRGPDSGHPGFSARSRPATPAARASPNHDATAMRSLHLSLTQSPEYAPPYTPRWGQMSMIRLPTEGAYLSAPALCSAGCRRCLRPFLAEMLRTFWLPHRRCARA